MKWFKSKRRPTISREEALKSVPVKNPHVEESRLESGDLLLVYPHQARPFFAALSERMGASQNRVFEKKLQLDALGTQVWDLIDGRRPVDRMIRDFAAAHQLHPREAEVSVTQFLRSLGKRGLIGLQ